MLINYSKFHALEDEWEALLERHGIEPPLHMKEFGRPHGRFAKITNKCRFELFSEVSELINDHKIYSISSAISNSEYQQSVSKEIREIFSVYGMSFMLEIVMNHKMAEHNQYKAGFRTFLIPGVPTKDILHWLTTKP